MNYIPGFSKYLETSVPRYAEGGAVADGAPVDYGATVMQNLRDLGMTDAEIAGLYGLSSANASGGVFNQGNYGSDFGSLDDVYGMNLASDMGSGGSGGGLYKVNPYMQTFQAPLSDKGNPTAYGGGGIDVKSPTQVFRLVDKNTGKVVYEGSGYEGAQEAINRAGALTAEGGAKAQWQIETPNSQQKSGYSVVANEKRSQSTLGDIASVALPIGMALLTGGMSLPAQMAAAGIAGAAGAGLAGKNPAKAGLISAATAGLMGGTGANEAIGKAVGSVGGALAGKTAEEVAKQAAAEAGEQIVVTGLSKALQGAGSAIGNTLLSEGVKGGLSSVTGYKPPAEKFADQPLPDTFQPPLDDTIVVSANKAIAGSGTPFGAAFSVPVNEMLSGALTATQPAAAEQPKTAEDIEAERNPIVVEGSVPTVTQSPGLGSALAGLPALGGLTSDPYLTNYDEPLASDIVVTGNVPTVTQDPGLGSALAGLPPVLGALPSDPALTTETPPKEGGTKLSLEDYIRLFGLAAGALGGGGGGGTGSYISGGRGVNPIFSAKLPTANIPGGVGSASNLGARQMGEQDWLTYGQRPEQSFYNYVPRPTGMAEGGALPAKHGGSSDRTEFAVNGPGTGRSDDIPAVLSDGEYVIDAETVALLGDGSSKAGAKKLDELRVKVRKHKGKKLAKGRFSANAKKPEAYLSGGRI